MYGLHVDSNEYFPELSLANGPGVDDQQCIRVRREHMPEPLSSTLVSSVVEVTPRRLLMPTGGRVTAFTAVPRPGYDGAAPRGRIIDEGPLAAQIAALYTKR